MIHTDSMAAAHDKRTDDWASPEHFQRYGHRYAAKIGAEIQREESRQWTVQSKEEPKSENEAPAPSTMLTKDTKDEEARSVLPRGSVTQQNITKLAPIATRSTAARTVNPTTDGAYVCRDQICSHPNIEFCVGRALAAAMVFHSRKILARASTAAAQYSAHP